MKNGLIGKWKTEHIVYIDLKSIPGTPFKRKPGYCLLPYINPGWVLSTMNVSFAYQNLRLVNKKANEMRNQLRLDTTRNFRKFMQGKALLVSLSRNSSFIPSPWSVVLILYSVCVLYLICLVPSHSRLIILEKEGANGVAPTFLNNWLNSNIPKIIDREWLETRQPNPHSAVLASSIPSPQSAVHVFGPFKKLTGATQHTPILL